MGTIVDLYSDKKGEISRFLSDFYKKNIPLKNELKMSAPYEWSRFTPLLISENAFAKSLNVR